MKFEIVIAATNEPYTDEVFFSADAASSRAKFYQEHITHRKLKIRRLPEKGHVDADGKEAWQLREEKRLRDGTYTPLPDWWQNATWWRSNEYSKNHYAHLSQDGMNIAFTESPEKGRDDRQLVLSPSKYLTRFFRDILYDHEIRDIAASLHRHKYVLHISNKSEDFERVYEDQRVGFEGGDSTSCMSYHRTNFHSNAPHHPAYIYGAGDLDIAWLEEKDAEEFMVAARAILYPENKTYSRVYATNMAAFGSLKIMLEELGYTYNSDLGGARLLKVLIESSAKNNYYLSCYIDGNSTYLKDEGEYFRITKYDDNVIPAGAGVVRLAKPVNCEHCGKLILSTEARTTTRNSAGEEIVICDDCLQYYRRCDATGIYYPIDDEFVSVIYIEGVTYSVHHSNVASHTVYCEGFNARVFDGVLYVYVGENGVEKDVSHLWLSTRPVRMRPDLDDNKYYDPRYHDVIGVDRYTAFLRKAESNSCATSTPLFSNTWEYDDGEVLPIHDAQR